MGWGVTSPVGTPCQHSTERQPGHGLPCCEDQLNGARARKVGDGGGPARRLRKLRPLRRGLLLLVLRGLAPCRGKGSSYCPR